MRIAHKLSETVLDHKIIEKVNVKLAMFILDESTISGLKHYGFCEIAAALELFLKFWFIVNVKSPTTGKHKHYIIRDVVKFPDDWKLDFLLNFEKYVQVRENSKVS